MMKAAVMHGVGDIQIENVPKPNMKDDEALVEIRSIGVCGSDVHYYEHGRIGNYIVTPPFILGHECAGVVVEVGDRVNNVTVGDRVAIEPGVPCRKCVFCRTGKYNLCREVVFLATPPVQGAFVQYLAHAADYLFPLPDNVSLHEGAMCEPLSTGMQAVSRSGLKLGDRVFIAGVGPIGLSALQAFRAAGAGAIYVSDLDQSRLENARNMGATEAFDATDPSLPDTLREICDGHGPEIAVETAGSEKATVQCLDVVRPGGAVVLVGLAPSATVPVNTLDVIDKEIDVRGVFRYANTYPSAIALIASGAVDVKSMVTDEYSLDDAGRAMADVAQRKPGTIKAVVTNG
jgi:L-iditol 2-dehydrogenase